MIPSVSANVAPQRPVPVTVAQTTARPAAPTGQGGSGKVAASNIRPETASAVRAPDHLTVAPRHLDQDTAECSERELTDKKAPTGPPPALEERPLERQARVALDPPDVTPEPEAEVEVMSVGEFEDAPGGDTADGGDPAQIDPPLTPRDRAEVSFSETRAIADPVKPASVDVSAQRRAQVLLRSLHRHRIVRMCRPISILR